MVRTSVVLSGLWIAIASTSLVAAPPLTDASLIAEPEYASEAPKYCLLAFGAAAETTIWLVHDGEVLYVDRNGNGDLTEPDERIAVEEGSDPEKGMFLFVVGNVHDGELIHKDLQVRASHLRHLGDTDERVRAHLETNPDVRFYMVTVDVEMPGFRGNGIGGRVQQTASFLDVNGCLVFSDAPDEAPIINFGGPWEITLFSTPQLRIGRQTDIFLGVATPGRGPGTTVFVAYEELIPPDVEPEVAITFLSDEPDASPFRELYEIKGRC